MTSCPSPQGTDGCLLAFIAAVCVAIVGGLGWLGKEIVL